MKLTVCDYLFLLIKSGDYKGERLASGLWYTERRDLITSLYTLLRAVVLDQGLDADLQADIIKYVEDLVNSGLRQRLISLIKELNQEEPAGLGGPNSERHILDSRGALVERRAVVCRERLIIGHCLVLSLLVVRARYVLVSKMRQVRSERTSSEMWKVAGLAIVSVICFTASSVVAFFTNIPVLYHCDWRSIGGIYASLLLILYYFIGSSVPSAFVLWIMRELPPSMAISVPGETRTLAFVSEYPTTTPPQHWTNIATAQNQASRASPI